MPCVSPLSVPPPGLCGCVWEPRKPQACTRALHGACGGPPLRSIFDTLLGRLVCPFGPSAETLVRMGGRRTVMAGCAPSCGHFRMQADLDRRLAGLRASLRRIEGGLLPTAALLAVLAEESAQHTATNPHCPTPDAPNSRTDQNHTGARGAALRHGDCLWVSRLALDHERGGLVHGLRAARDRDRRSERARPADRGEGEGEPEPEAAEEAAAPALVPW